MPREYNFKEIKKEISSLIKNNWDPYDKIDCFNRAKALFNQIERNINALPAFIKEDFKSRHHYFKYLVTNDHDLFVALCRNPNIINKQDERGMTLLHHIACPRPFDACSVPVVVILHLLFKWSNFNFLIQDKHKNTALHLAAKNCEDKAIQQCVFPYFLKKARIKKFDFSIQNEFGLTVLHIAAFKSYKNPIFGKCNNVEKVLPEISDIQLLNVLSNSKMTALDYALKYNNIDSARMLLIFGADPYIGHMKQRLVCRQELIGIMDDSIEYLNNYSNNDNDIKYRISNLENYRKELLCSSQARVTRNKSASFVVVTVKQNSIFSSSRLRRDETQKLNCSRSQSNQL